MSVKDFFISYNKADKDWAEWIAWTLEEAGYSVLFQDWDFRPGENFVLKMQEATTETRQTIAVLSDAYLNAAYTQPEWAIAFANDPQGKERKLLPIRVRECSPTGLLATLIYVDLVNLSEPDAKLTILKALKLRGTPSESPKFPLSGRPTITADREASPEVKPYPGISDKESDLGPLVFKLCDRTSQVSTFTEHFISNLKSRAGVPQFYFIHGEEKECHDSLIERLAHTQIKSIAEKRWGEQRGVVALKKPLWPHEGELPELKIELQRQLFSEFDPAYMDDDLSVKALYKLTHHLLAPLILIRHSIYATQWNPHTRDFLIWYLNYWAELKEHAAEPQIIIFFNIIYPSSKNKNWWRAWLPFNKFDKEVIQQELQNIYSQHNTGCPFLILKELIPPKQIDVGDWFRRHNIYDVKMQWEFLDKLFEPDSEDISMADIEHELYKIHQSFIREKGYL